jgi:hypothetical protein
MLQLPMDESEKQGVLKMIDSCLSKLDDSVKALMKKATREI